MFRPTAVTGPLKTGNTLLQSKNSYDGYLLISQEDKIIYANRQARRYLGLLADEKEPVKQTFLSLAQLTYQCYPAKAWLSWLKTPSPTATRYLIYAPPHSRDAFQLNVDVLQQMIIDGTPIWVITLVAVNLPTTAVLHPIIS
jgi:PAS domain-containing protein